MLFFSPIIIETVKNHAQCLNALYDYYTLYIPYSMRRMCVCVLCESIERLSVDHFELFNVL